MTTDAPPAPPRLVADIGGTRARFALSGGPGHLGPVVELASAEAAPEILLRRAMERLGPPKEGPVRQAALAVAGPVIAGRAALTNLPWQLEASALARDSGLESVALLNDFAAVALALPLLGPADRRPIGDRPGAGAGPETDAGPRTMLVLGPGTGLGLAAAVPDGRGGWAVASGEGGHVTLPARDATEWRLLQRLGAGAAHLSAERICSGPGLEALYRVVQEPIIAAKAAAPDAPAIAAAALAGEPRACACLGHFADFLATVAGDAALTFGARGGVTLAGGVLPRLGAAFDWARFRRRFADKGRFSAYLRELPLHLMTHPQPGLLGLTALRWPTADGAP